MNAKQKKQLSKIRKLIRSNDLGDVEQGLAVLDALDDPELWAVLAAGLSVDGQGMVVIPEDSEVHGTVAEAHRVHVALWALNRTGRLQERLNLSECSSLQNVDGLKGSTNLTDLDLRECESLQNVDGLEGCTNLTTLYLSWCTSLQNVDGLEGCTNLTDLSLFECESLENVDGLEGLTNLTDLNLSYCRSLENVDVLKGLTNLTTLYLQGCGSLQNVDVLKGLTNLTTLNLWGCSSLQGIAPKPYEGAATIRALFSHSSKLRSTELTVNNLGECISPQNVDVLRSLPNLTSLTKGVASGYETFEGREQIQRFTGTKPTGTPDEVDVAKTDGSGVAIDWQRVGCVVLFVSLGLFFLLFLILLKEAS